jgi:hypothetical protein
MTDEISEVAAPEEFKDDFAKLFERDREYQKTELEKGPPDVIVEAKALANLFEDASACETCARTLGARWQAACLDKWALWRDQEDESIGNEIIRVATHLGDPIATHLLPTGIYERLSEGNTGVCFGLATLLGNFTPPGSKSSE